MGVGGLGARLQGVGFKFWGLRSGVLGLGSWFEGCRVGAQGLGCKMKGLRLNKGQGNLSEERKFHD